VGTKDFNKGSKMARPLRITYPGAFYHVTSRGNERKAVFKSKRDREKFLEYLESATQRYDARIHAYCMMDTHYHLLLETPSGNLSQIMRHINGAYTTYFRDNFLSAKKLDKELPALKEFAKKTSMREIFKEVELVFTDDKVLSRNVKMYLCQRYTGKKLKEIGLHFGIGESGVSQACRRVAHKIEKDKKLKKKIESLEKQLNL
jgi:REP element-mobilizing transposase RayT